MSLKKPEKSPYRDYSIEEVMATEAGAYYIQLGTSIFESETGKLAFNKDRAEEFFEMAYLGLQDLKANGTYAEKEEATNALLHFRIIPLKFH